MAPRSDFVLAHVGFVCHEPYMSARRILQSFNKSSKATKKALGLGLAVVLICGFAACRGIGSDETDTSNDQLTSPNGQPLPYKPNLNLM
jgi:hypothetical protein